MSEQRPSIITGLKIEPIRQGRKPLTYTHRLEVEFNYDAPGNPIYHEKEHQLHGVGGFEFFDFDPVMRKFKKPALRRELIPTEDQMRQITQFAVYFASQREKALAFEQDKQAALPL